MHIYTIGEQEIWFLFFSIRITFEQVSKQRLKVKKLNKEAKCKNLTGFLTTYLNISAKLV